MLVKQDILQKIRDDLYLTGKQTIMDNLPENQNALFIGKLRIPTRAHIDIVEQALTRFHHVVICIVKAAKEVKESLPFEKQEEILEAIFKNKISVISATTGNITTIVGKSPKRIRYLLAGSDRVDGYKTQLAKMPSISIVETTRDMDSEDNISATKVIEAIKSKDEATFKKMTHPRMWKLFNELGETFK